LLADGDLACTDVTKGRPASATTGWLARRDFSLFQSYWVGEFAAEFLCPKQPPHALMDLRSALVKGHLALT
jgi:hypothetical protein